MKNTYELAIVDDTAAGMTTVVPFREGTVSIGRELGNAIQLTERNISRHHARLVRAGDQVGVEDLGSYTGVRVNGQRIVGSAAIAEGDRVQIGDYILALRRVAVAQSRHDRLVAIAADVRTAPAADNHLAVVGEQRSAAQDGEGERRPARALLHRRVKWEANAWAWALMGMLTIALLCWVGYYQRAAVHGVQGRAAAPASAARQREALRSLSGYRVGPTRGACCLLPIMVQ